MRLYVSRRVCVCVCFTSFTSKWTIVVANFFGTLKYYDTIEFHMERLAEHESHMNAASYKANRSCEREPIQFHLYLFYKVN